MTHQEQTLKKIRDDWRFIKEINNPSVEHCIEAVMGSYLALQYLPQKILTPEFLLKVVEQNCYAIEFVEEQTLEMCLTAVNQDGILLGVIKNQTPEICLAAVRQNGWAIEYVKNQTREICLAALKEDNSVGNFIKDHSVLYVTITF